MIWLQGNACKPCWRSTLACGAAPRGCVIAVNDRPTECAVSTAHPAHRWPARRGPSCLAWLSHSCATCRAATEATRGARGCCLHPALAASSCSLARCHGSIDARTAAATGAPACCSKGGVQAWRPEQLLPTSLGQQQVPKALPADRVLLTSESTRFSSSSYLASPHHFHFLRAACPAAERRVASLL